MMPPKMAPYQVAILPFINDDSDRGNILEYCEKIKRELQTKDISVQIDKSDARSSDKMWTAIKKGVPIRLEVGAREIAENQVVFTRRDLGKDGKTKISVTGCVEAISSALHSMQKKICWKKHANVSIVRLFKAHRSKIFMISSSRKNWGDKS